MKRKTTKKELEGVVEKLSTRLSSVEGQVASYNALFSMYVKYSGDSADFQQYLKEELGQENAKTGQIKYKKD